KSLYGIALLIFVLGVGGLIYSGVVANSVYFLNVQEALAAPPEKVHQIRLFGTVASKDLNTTPKTPGVDFLLEDRDDIKITVPVQFRGAVPDTFKSGAEVIVEGSLNQDRTFIAKTLMTKCPSKYQKENRNR
ncbi:MAG: cytochrome c maturation protein CcmE, partial [Desulfovibrionaceae bacterium]|nr:cytochrome c maturation protein CcmE [Desulfovibrionaceae bacterium]